MAGEDLSWGTFLGLGLTAALILVVGLALGWLADHFLGTSPILMFVGLVLGIAGAASFIIVRFRSYLNS